MEIAICLSDLHYPYHCPKYISIATQLIKALKPDHVIQLGDALDAASISTYLQHPATKSNLIHEIELYNEQLDRWQKIMKKGSSFHQLEGNHCERLTRYISRNCRDIHEFVKPIPELLKLKERSIESGVRFIWHPLKFWNHCKIHDVVFHHGTYFDKNIATSNLQRYGVKFIQGHSHRYAHASDGKVWSVSLGHGSIAEKTSHIHAPNTWQQAIGVVTFIKGKGHFEPMLINNGEGVFRGKLYKA